MRLFLNSGNGKLYTMTPSSVLGDRRTPGQLPDVTLGILVPVSLLSLRGKASSKLANSAGQQSAVSAILGDAKPTHFVSRAQARRSVKRGRRSFLVLVSHSDSSAP